MRPTDRTLDRSTVRSVVVMSVAVFVIGASYGVAAHAAGLAWWQILLIATVVLAGSSEFVFVGILAAGGSPLLAALAGLLVNSRNFGYGLAVGGVLPRGLPMLAAAHLINDETAALTASARRDPTMSTYRIRLVFVACGVGILVGWPLGSLVGAVLGEVIASPEALGLDAAFPALLIALALPALRHRRTARAAAAGGAIALLTTPFAPAGLPIVAALGGMLARGRR